MVVEFMANPFENVIDIIVALLFMFLFPIIIINQEKDIIVNTVVEEKLDDFVDNISVKGYVSKKMYEDFAFKISKLMPGSQIAIEHQARIYYPIYERRDGKDFFTGKMEEIYIYSWNNEILEAISTDKNKYYLNQGDYFNVKITLKSSYLKGKTVRGVGL